MCKWFKFFAASCVLTPAIWTAPCQAADLKVLSDGPLRTALAQIVPEFRAQTGHAVEVVYGTAPALKAKLAAGEKADILISLAPEIAELKQAARLAETQDAVASIKLGLAVRRGAAVPDIKTLEAFKRTLLHAETIIHNDLASGRAFARQLERIGIAEQVQSKIVLVKGNGQLQELAKRTGNDVAGGQLTQIIAENAVQFVGPLPPEAQSETIYSAGVFSDSHSRDAAKDFLLFLTSPKAKDTLIAVGAK
jgi:molybdate transport system substrate-binding protein